MALVDWPSSPTVGQQYEFNERFWVYTAAGGWKQVLNGNQVGSVFLRYGPLVNIYGNLTTQSTNWLGITYV